MTRSRSRCIEEVAPGPGPARLPPVRRRRRRRRASRPARRCSTARAGTGSRSTRRAAATGRARNARCACRRASRPCRRSTRARSRPTSCSAGWRLACRAQAEHDVVVEVPPLQTRPKAALAGVGRHVILRPAVQKRHLELDRPTLEDQTSDLERVLAGMDDVELRVPLEIMRDARAHASRLRLERDGRVRRRSPDRRRAGRHERPSPCDRVRPRHDDRRRDAAGSRDRAAGRGSLDAQHAAAVRRRRHLADQRDDARRRRARPFADAGPRHAHAAHERGLRGSGRRAG